MPESGDKQLSRLINLSLRIPSLKGVTKILLRFTRNDDFYHGYVLWFLFYIGKVLVKTMGQFL